MLIFRPALVRHLAGDTVAFDREPATFPAELSRNVASNRAARTMCACAWNQRPGQPPLAHPVLGKSGLLKTLLLPTASSPSRPTVRLVGERWCRCGSFKRAGGER